MILSSWYLSGYQADEEGVGFDLIPLNHCCTTDRPLRWLFHRSDSDWSNVRCRPIQYQSIKIHLYFSLNNYLLSHNKAVPYDGNRVKFCSKTSIVKNDFKVKNSMRAHWKLYVRLGLWVTYPDNYVCIQSAFIFLGLYKYWQGKYQPKRAQ